MGLRELKKQRTRKAISDLATQLFLDRGYNNVTTAEIAELAEVSIPTLFKYFPAKEMLVFDEDIEIEQWLINSVANKKKNESVLDALLIAGIQRIHDIPSDHKKNAKRFMDLIDSTPELSLYASQMWLRHEKVLATVIRKESKKKLSQIESECIARFVLDALNRSMRTNRPKESLQTLFSILKKGFAG